MYIKHNYYEGLETESSLLVITNYFKNFKTRDDTRPDIKPVSHLWVK